MKNVLKPLAKSVLIPLGLTAASSATDAAIHKKMFGLGMTTPIISNEEMNDIMKIVMKTVGVEEWIVQFVQAMYNNTRSKVRVNNTCIDEFRVKVGVHHGSLLSPLLFIIVLEALSGEFCTGTPWELLYADDLVIIAETKDELRMKLIKWKTNLEETKIMISGVDLQMLKNSGKYPCSVCRKGVGSNSIYCTGCLHWVPKKCSGIIGKLKSNPDYRCRRCKGTAKIQLMGDLITNGYLSKIKNWMLLIHFVTFEIRWCWRWL